MTVSMVGGKASQSIQSLVDLRNTLDDLQRQLSTGKKSTTYAGLGIDRGLSVSLRSQLSAIGSYDDTISTVSTRISVAQTSLGRMSDIGNAVKSAMIQGSYGTGATGAATAQKTAQFSLDEMLGLLNTQAGDRYLFGGRATDQPPVETYDHILNGDGARAGLLQIIDERKQADLGASGLGRLTITSPTATSVAVSEDAVSPFGFKLASVSSTLTNATVTGPAGSPAALSVDMSGGNPNAGDAITLRFNLPDGTTENLTLTATANSPPGNNEFTIGANPTATTANLQAALTTAVGKLAGSALTAASATQASNEFFSADSATPPPRVDGPPFDSATAMTTGSSADTVIWYTGETGSDSARSTATARIDPALVVGYGVRGNEDGLRNVIQNIATLAAVTVSPTDPNGADLSTALNQRLTANLTGSPGDQTIADIQTDLAGAQVSLNAAKTRHQQQNATLGDFLEQIEGVSNEEVGASILTLQTRLQASMQVTSLLYQTSLVNYL
jgi:flagellin-like hook-associated protein FlgL